MLMGTSVLGCNQSPARSTASSLPTTSSFVTHGPRARDITATSAPGTARHECVDVDPLREADHGEGNLDVRSGELLAGNFRELTGQGQPGDPDFQAKVYWLPLGDDEVVKTNPLILTVQSLSDPAAPPTVLTLGGDGVWAQAGDGYFWPSGVALPSHGRWRLEAQAPGHCGCFVLSI